MDNIIFDFSGISITWEGIGILIAAVFSVITFLGNILQFLLKKREQKKKNNIEYITNKRVDWIYAVRQEAASFLSIAHVLGKQAKKSDTDIIKLNEKLYILELYLNFNGIVDKILIQLMYKIIDDIRDGDSNLLNAHAQMFCNNLRIYLKVEWNRVKAETNGQSYNYKKNINELLNAYKKYKISDDLNIIDINGIIKLLEKELKKK